ncbi:MAG: bifunctional alpha/beta hydrolase/OsmC family protein [Acidobacteriota bacterium]
MRIHREKLTFDNQRGEELAALLEQPDEPRALALFAHCFTCSKDIAAASRISRALGRKGIGVLRFDFTGLGNSEGDFANTNFSSNVQDLLAAAQALRERFEAPQILIGHSLGGAAVLAAAGDIEECRAVATIGAPADPGHLRHLFLEGDVAEIESQGSATVTLGGRQFRIKKQFLEDISSQRLARRLNSLQRALLIMHSPEDSIVSIDEAAKIYQAARHPKSFISLDRADHLLGRKEDSEYVATVLSAWASRYLDPVEEEDEEVREGIVEVVEQGPLYTQTVRARSHRIEADEPRSLRGRDAGMTPYELLLAALGSCTAITLRMYANHKKWPLEHVSMELTHAKIHAQDCAECEAKEGKIDRMTRRISLQGDLSPEQRARLLQIANRCPVHRSLESENQIVTDLAE